MVDESAGADEPANLDSGSDATSSETQDSEPEPEEETAMKAVEPIQATKYEKIAAVVVLAMMALSMAYIAYTVVLYWHEVGV